MPSRKRAKGRARKLKQQAREPAVERSVSQPPQSPNGENINLLEQNARRIEHEENVGCDHGWVYTPQGHPVTDFFNSFLDILENSRVSTTFIRFYQSECFKKHHDVLQDDAIRKMVIDRMVSMGADFIIRKCIVGARMISEVIIFLELWRDEAYPSALSKVTGDFSYMLNAGETDIVHFYKKRMSCSCLDELYSEIKKCQVRCSKCDHCNQITKRKDLKTCSRCKCIYYCSKECQALDWPRHKEFCKGICH